MNSCTLYRNFSVEMEEPLEKDKQRMNIDKLKEDVQKAEKEIKEVENLLQGF